MDGTNFFVGVQGNNNPALVNAAGNGVLCAGASPFTTNTSGYAVGCLMMDTSTGKLYSNTGTTTSATWTAVGTQT